MTGIKHDNQVLLFCMFVLLSFSLVVTGIIYISIVSPIINNTDLGVKMLFNGLKISTSEAVVGSNNGLILEKNNETGQKTTNDTLTSNSLVGLNVIPSPNTEKCNCVVFRLDDVQDNDLNKTQLALMKVFLDKHQKLSLGLIMNFIGNNTSIVNKLNEGVHRKLFELAIHGWDHVDYSKLVEREQHDSLLKASKKMQNIFDIQSKIFIPPYNDFNSNTLHVLSNMSFKIISSMVRNEAGQDIFNSTKDRLTRAAPLLYHVPETASFEKWNGQENPTSIPLDQILNTINDSINKYGYAVVTLHPETFSKSEDGNYTDTIDESQVNELEKVIDYIVSENIRITSFSKLTGID